MTLKEGVLIGNVSECGTWSFEALASSDAQPFQPVVVFGDVKPILLVGIARGDEAGDHVVCFGFRCCRRFAGRLHGVQPPRSQIETGKAFVEDTWSYRALRRSDGCED